MSYLAPQTTVVSSTPSTDFHGLPTGEPPACWSDHRPLRQHSVAAVIDQAGISHSGNLGQPRAAAQEGMGDAPSQ